MSYSSAYQFSSSTYEATSAAAAPTLSVQSSNAGLLGGRSSAANQQTVSQIANDLVQLNQSGRLSVANALTSSLSVHANANANAAPCQQQQAPPQGKKPCVDAGPRVNCNNAGSCVFLSEIEQAILRSSVPVEVNETEEITVLGETGLWANKQEVVNWKGVVPIAEYAINEDCDPEVITKRTEQKLEYVQELAIRYLRPPTPPPPGEILIKQEVNTLTPPAPPLIIRQQPPRPSTPEPLVIREAPPQPPPQVCQKVITISGKRLPPPPRKVVIERLAPLPSKPQSVIVERWLPYSEVKRRVIFQRSNERDAVCCRPRNVIVQWEAPQVNVRKEIKYLGVIRANPAEYVQRYGASLKLAKDLPEFVLEIKTPDGLVLAADYQYNSVHELEGDLQAFKLVDLDKEGLAEYRAQLAKLGISFVGAEAAAAHALAGGSLSAFGSAAAASAAAASGSASAAGTVRSVVSSLHSASSSNLHSVVNQIFEEVDRNSNGRLEVNEAEKVLLRLNSALGRSYGEDEVNAFFEALDADNDGTISLEEFRAAFEKQF